MSSNYGRFCHATLAIAYGALLLGVDHLIVASWVCAAYVALVFEPDEDRD